MMRMSVCLLYVSWHCHADILSCVGPVKVNPSVSSTIPVVCDDVVFLEDTHEELHIFLGGVFYSKVIYYQFASNWYCSFFHNLDIKLLCWYLCSFTVVIGRGVLLVVGRIFIV